MTTVEDRIRNVYAAYPAIEPRTGIPMELVVVIETHDDQTILTNGSYYAHNRIYDVLHVTDRDDYHVDELTSLMTTSEGERPIPTEQENAELIAPEFVEAVRDGREPFVPGWSVLPDHAGAAPGPGAVGRQARQAAHPRAGRSPRRRRRPHSGPDCEIDQCHAKNPKSCAATAGTARRTSARSAIGPARPRWATSARTTRASR